MDKFLEFIRRNRDQMGGFWRSLNTPKKIALLGGLVITLVALISFTMLSKKEERDYLYQGLSAADTQAIADELKKMNMNDFNIDAKGISVKSDQVVPLRLKLAQEGLPTHGQIGWEKFDEQDFSRTEFEQKINRLRAIQGELGRTIQQVDGVLSARVHIVSPNKSIFIEDKKEPTAAVYIKTKRGVELDNRQVKGIVHLVSSSVEGLSPEKVTIIDHEGKLLTKVESNDMTSKFTQEMVLYRKNQETQMEEKIRGIVGRIVGPERIEAKVDVELDFTKEEQVISDVDPDRVVVIASNTTNQEMAGNGLNPTGIPGAKSNVPGEQEELAPNESKTKSTRASERMNYEVSKKQSRKVLPIGTIQRISASVLVDGSQPYPLDGSPVQFQPRTPEEMKKIEELVRTAIGYKDGRDSVTVHNMLFQLDQLQVQVIDEKKQKNREYLSTLFISGAVAFALVLFFAFVVRPYFRWLSYNPERKQAETTFEELNPTLEMGGIANVQVKEEVPFEKLTPQEQIRYLAEHEPLRTTEALRILLNPHHTAT